MKLPGKGYTPCENCKGKGTVQETKTTTVKGKTKTETKTVNCPAGCLKGNVVSRLL